MQTKIKISGMACAHCVGVVTKALEKITGVEQADVNLQAGQATITGNADTDSLLKAIREKGYEAQLV